MVGLGSSLNGEQEGAVCVMVWFVDDGEVGGSLVGATEIGAVAFGAMGDIELGASRDELGVLGWNFDVVGLAAAGGHQ